ncbi:MAG TPA: HAMP domain-containing sensor histidine kinase [Pseudonocardiaceae bacterium]|nr:HAMP domain-containing sensor histidine kinase [Pseudonocardiaceae bacterium]
MTRVRSVDDQVVSRAAWRIGLQTAASVVIAVVGLAAVAVLVDLHSQHQNEDALLARSIARADVDDPPAGVWLVVRRGGHDDVTPDLPAGLPDNAEFAEVTARRTGRTAVVTARGRQYRVHTQPLPGGGVVQAVLDLRSDRAATRSLLEAFLVAGLVGLAMSAAAGVLLARRAVRPLAAALALQRRFVADAGHELRTPLTLLTTRAQVMRRTLQSGADVEPVRADIEHLVADAHHLTAILEDLLLTVDPREPQDVGQVSLPSVVAEVVDSARPSADEHDVTLSSTTVGEPRPVPGAEAALRRAVTALVDNAIRHAHSQVRVTTTAAADAVCVDVVDDGPGIAPDMASTLFDRFATSPSDGLAGTTRRYGIGLALVSEIAARHGGSVSVVETGGPGAALRLRIPVRR